MGEQWFSEEELEEMSRPTMDRAIEAIDRGDLDQARALCGAMKHEWRSLHDLMVDGIAGLLLEAGVPSLSRRAGGFDVPDFLAAGPRDVLVPESGVETALATLHRADVEPAAALPPTPATRGHVVRVLLAIVAGAGAAAGLAWLLSHAAP